MSVYYFSYMNWFLYLDAKEGVILLLNGWGYSITFRQLIYTFLSFELLVMQNETFDISRGNALLTREKNCRKLILSRVA